MIAYEFSAKPKDGLIKLPEELSELNQELRLIALTKSIGKSVGKLAEFKAISLNTKGFRFHRDEANER
jgi:hypothetical protein